MVLWCNVGLANSVYACGFSPSESAIVSVGSNLSLLLLPSPQSQTLSQGLFAAEVFGEAWCQGVCATGIARFLLFIIKGLDLYSRPRERSLLVPL